MLRPTPEEVLQSISYTLDTLIRPDPAGPLATSYALTCSNMLRHLQLCIQHEETAITADTIELRDALEQARAFLVGIGDREVATGIADALAVRPAGPAPARAARENWRALRRVIEQTIAHLQTLRDRHGARADYRATRQAIRDYLDRSLDREAILIDGAFTLARR